MPNRQHIKTILHDRHLAPSKRLGQNFLVDEEVVELLLDRAAPGENDTIVEFGVGLGSLTIPLARRVKRVIGIEIDSGIIRWHEEKGVLPSHVSLRHADLLKTDFRALAAETGGRLKIIANLPYSISGPLLFALIEHHRHIESAVLMLQKEVAERLVARPGSKAYGVLSVLLGACARIEAILEVGPEHFHPRPKVDSLVVRMCFQPPAPGMGDGQTAMLKALVKGAFQQRRKTIVNALATAAIGGVADKEVIAQRLGSVGIEPARRADQITVGEYLLLARAYGGE